MKMLNALSSVPLKKLLGVMPTGSPTILEMAVLLLQRSEQALDTSRTIDIPLLRPVTRILSTLGLLQGGAWLFMRPALFFVLYSCIAQIIIFWCKNNGILSQGEASNAQYAAFLFVALITAFELPSQYVSDKVHSKIIRRVKTEFTSECDIGPDEAKHILDTLKELHERASARVRTAQWIITFAWASLLFVWAQYSSMAQKNLSPNDFARFLSDSISNAVAFAAITLLCAWVTFGYKRAIERIFLTARVVMREVQISSNGPDSGKNPEGHDPYQK
ncbi:hypothetical protein [Cupriavidus necator]|uniref:hypothetical protein n=1 Tax=Cupriavidus necator TaxID=106590 RepID=UPI00339D7057